MFIYYRKLDIGMTNNFSNSINSTIGAANSGSENSLTITNPSNTSNSGVVCAIQGGGSTALGPYLRLGVPSTAGAIFYLQPDGLGFNLSYAADGTVTPATSTNTPIRFDSFDTVNNGSRTIIKRNLVVADENSGSSEIDIDGSSVSSPIFKLLGPVAGGNASVQYAMSGNNWGLGSDAANSNNFYLTQSATTFWPPSAGNTIMEATTGGSIYFPNAGFTTDGVLYSGSSGQLLTTSAGTAGQVLTSNGPGVAPTYQTQAAGGAWTLLQTQTASNSANITFTSTYITSTYNKYALVMNNVVPATNGVSMNMTVSVDNGSNYLATGYKAVINVFSESATANAVSSTTLIPLTIISGNTLANTTGIGLMGTLYMTNWTSGTNYPEIHGNCAYLESSAANTLTGLWGGRAPTTSAINNIKIVMSSGNISTGTFSLYGISS
jgi:hypothetical protein